MFRRKTKHQSLPKAIIQRVTADAMFPSYGSERAAYMDVSVIEGANLQVGETRAFRTGLTVQCPPGHYLEVVSRSGLSMRGLTVANAPAIIDEDYRGELFILLRADRKITVEAGQRVAQMQFVKLAEVDIYEGLVSVGTGRGKRGLGSTGT